MLSTWKNENTKLLSDRNTMAKTQYKLVRIMPSEQDFSFAAIASDHHRIIIMEKKKLKCVRTFEFDAVNKALTKQFYLADIKKLSNKISKVVLITNNFKDEKCCKCRNIRE